MRKDHLAEIGEARIGYSQYKSLLDGVQRVLTDAWTSKVSHRKKASKKGKHHHSVSVGNGIPSPPAHGIGEKAKLALQKRKELLALRPIFEQAPPGWYTGVPTSSIYGLPPTETRDVPAPSSPSADNEQPEMNGQM